MATQTVEETNALDNPFANLWAVVRGGGDVISGPIQRLRWAGFNVIVTELSHPLVVRRLVAFANAIYEGECEVEGTPAKLVDTIEQAKAYLKQHPQGVPVLVDPDCKLLDEINPTILIDGRMAKAPLDSDRNQAPIVIGLGPGLEAGVHVDAVVETKGGSQCGRVYYEGTSIEDTGIPCVSSGYRQERVIRAPTDGVFESCAEIGDQVEADAVVGWISNAAGKTPVKTQIAGVVRGLIYNGLNVSKGLKLGDLDHRGESSDCCRVSEKADSVAAGVLEAIFRLGLQRGVFVNAADAGQRIA